MSKIIHVSALLANLQSNSNSANYTLDIRCRVIRLKLNRAKHLDCFYLNMATHVYDYLTGFYLADNALDIIDYVQGTFCTRNFSVYKVSL